MKSRIVTAIGRELVLLCRIAFDVRHYFIAKIALLVGFGYLFVPIDIIPDRIPVIGHLDEATFVIGGFVLARAFADPVPRQRDPGATAPPRLFRLLGYRGWWIIRAPLGPRRSRIRGLVVVGGAARSGTTMLRTILGRHPLIASGPETTVFLRRITAPRHLGPRLRRDGAEIERWQVESRSQVAFIEQFHRAILTNSRRLIWVEKTPANVFRFGFVARRFPNAKLVHIIRDGRDAACSLRRQPWAKIARTIPRDSPLAARRCGALWAASVRAGIAHRGHPRYCELRYEDLVTDPEATLRRLLTFLDIPWDDRLLDAALTPLLAGGVRPGHSADWQPDLRLAFTRDAIAADSEIFGDSIGRWRNELSAADRAALAPVIGGLLVTLGYEHDAEAWAIDAPCAAAIAPAA